MRDVDLIASATANSVASTELFNAVTWRRGVINAPAAHRSFRLSRDMHCRWSGATASYRRAFWRHETKHRVCCSTSAASLILTAAMR